MERSEVVFEFRPLVGRSGSMIFVPFQTLLGLEGFQSVFGVSLDTARELYRLGSRAGFCGEVYCDTLLVDFDDTPEQAKAAEEFFEKAGIAFLKYDSGNRSIHFHVPIVPMTGENVPFSVRSWVLTNLPGADLSFYHHQGMYRLPGTRHQKTGRRKTLLRKSIGTRLRIPPVLPKSVENGVCNVADGIEEILMKAVQLILDPPTKGNRHTNLWSLGSRLKAAGFTNEFIEEFLNGINEQWKEKKSRNEIQGIALRL